MREDELTSSRDPVVQRADARRAPRRRAESTSPSRAWIPARGWSRLGPGYRKANAVVASNAPKQHQNPPGMPARASTATRLRLRPTEFAESTGGTGARHPPSRTATADLETGHACGGGKGTPSGSLCSTLRNAV